MVSQNLRDTLDEIELEKQKEKTMKPLDSHNNKPFEITKTPAANSLIPRITFTNIIVCPVNLFNSDIHRYLNSRSLAADNIRHDIRATNGISTHDMSLHKAARRGDITAVQEVVKNRRELLLLVEPEEGNIALHTAVLKGHKEVATYLFNAYPQGCYVLNSKGVTPLYLAVQRKDLDLVENMFCKLDKDDNVFHNLDKGKSIVRVAIEDNNQEMLKIIFKHQPGLIKCIDEEDLTPLSYAASKGFVGIASYILKKYPKSIKERNKDRSKSYPVHKAAQGGHVEVLKMFHAKIPDSLLYRDNFGQTILHIAANKERGNKFKPVVSYLLSLNVGEKLKKIKDENEKYPLV